MFKTVTLRTRTVALLAILVTGILSGCIDDDKDCVDGVCQEIANPGDVFIANATQPLAEWEGCHGAFLNTQLPRDMVDPHVPDGFDGLGRAAFLRDVRLEVIDCPRAVIADLVVEPFQYANMALFVSPTNDSWEPGETVSNYVYETFVSNESAAMVLRDWGFPSMHARFEIKRSDAAIGYVDEYLITADDRSYAFSVSVIDQPGSKTTFPMTFWSGDDSYERIDRNFTRGNAVNSQGLVVLKMEGAAKMAEIHGQNSAPFDVQPYREASDVWRPYPIPFFPS